MAERSESWNQSGGEGRSRYPHVGLWLRISLGLLLGVGMLYLAGRAIQFQQLAKVLSGVRWPFVGLTLLTSLLTPVLKAVRWRWLLYPRRLPLSSLHLASLVVIGQAVNFLIPGRWGELVRAYLTGEEGGVSKVYILGTLAAEKLVDLIVLALLVLGLIPFLTWPAGLAVRVELLGGTAVAVSVGAAVLLGGRNLWLRLSERVLSRLPERVAIRWCQWIVAGLDGLSALGSPAALWRVWGWTVLFWLVAATTNLLLLLAFDLPASWLMALVLLAILQGGIAVPSTPGKVGVFHYLCVAGLSLFGIPRAVGLGYGLVLHFLVVGGISVWAALALWQRSWSLGRLVVASMAWR